MTNGLKNRVIVKPTKMVGPSGTRGNCSICRKFYKIGFLEQPKIQFFRVRTLIEYFIFRAFSRILGIYEDGFKDRARRTTMTTMPMKRKLKMTITTMKMTTTTTTISRRRKLKMSRRRGKAGRGEGSRPEGAARHRPSGRGRGRRTTTTMEMTKTARTAAAERTIVTRTQEEEEEEAEIIGHSFFSMPAPLPPSAPTELKLDKHTACMW